MPFIDIDNHWATKEIHWAYKNNLLNGTAPDTFEPNTAITRGMLVTVLWRMEGYPSADNFNPFIDVSNNVYYSDAVIWASANNIVMGIDDNLFAPDLEITRQDIAVLFLRYLDNIEVDYAVTQEYREFTDENDIAGYAKNAVQVLNKLGIINGKGNNIIDPQGKATRAEAAAMLYRLITLTKS